MDQIVNAVFVQPVISVIIPCYNHGHFIQEAIDSVLDVKGIDYEIIIINDGSTDAYTINKLHQLQAAGFKVLSHANSGLGFTRNAGVQAALGKYILPLDADNKIKPEYIYKALPLLENGSCDIVYARPVMFGDMHAERKFTVKPFDILDLSIANYIDACAVYKKEVWTSVGGYDTQMPYPGHEDWEFWLHAYTKSFRFSYIDEELFYYRVVKNSMIAATSALDKDSLNYRYIVKKHASFYSKKYGELYYIHKAHAYDVAHPFRSVIKFMYLNYFKKKRRPTSEGNSYAPEPQSR